MLLHWAPHGIILGAHQRWLSWWTRTVHMDLHQGAGVQGQLLPHSTSMHFDALCIKVSFWCSVWHCHTFDHPGPGHQKILLNRSHCHCCDQDRESYLGQSTKAWVFPYVKSPEDPKDHKHSTNQVRHFWSRRITKTLSNFLHLYCTIGFFSNARSARWASLASTTCTTGMQESAIQQCLGETWWNMAKHVFLFPHVSTWIEIRFKQLKCLEMMSM